MNLNALHRQQLRIYFEINSLFGVVHMKSAFGMACHNAVRC